MRSVGASFTRRVTIKAIQLLQLLMIESTLVHLVLSVHLQNVPAGAYTYPESTT